MSRTATTVTISLRRDDAERFEQLVERFGGGSRSAFVRTAMHRMETAELATELRDLRAAMAPIAAERGVTSQKDVSAFVRHVLNDPAHLMPAAKSRRRDPS